MQITNEISKIGNSKVYLTIGSYDGIHIGHQRIIADLVASAGTNCGKAVVLSFANHPLEIINPRRAPKRILTREERYALLEGLGVDILVELDFDGRLASTTAAVFAETILKTYRPELLIAGPDCAFGKNGEGNPEMLRNSGFVTRIFDAVCVDGRVVSSTAIRNMIRCGEMKKAAKMLGFYYSLSGEIIHGISRGKLLGYPTINVDYPKEKIEPAIGVYICRVKIKGICYCGVTNFGMSPTVDVNCLRLETHILDFSGDIYGETATVEFVKYLRPETSFDSIADLKAQLRDDCNCARNYFGSRIQEIS